MTGCGCCGVSCLVLAGLLGGSRFSFADQNGIEEVVVHHKRIVCLFFVGRLVVARVQLLAGCCRRRL